LLAEFSLLLKSSRTSGSLRISLRYYLIFNPYLSYFAAVVSLFYELYSRMLFLLVRMFVSVCLVARVKSTARPMTTEELIAAGLPVDPIIEGAEHAAPPEDTGSPSGSRSREDGEVQSDDGEDIGDVDAGVSDLVRAKTSGPLPPSLAFGESKVTTNMVREYERAGFFPRALGEPRLMSKSPPLRTEWLSSFVISSFAG
jgi:hypothetical protein